MAVARYPWERPATAGGGGGGGAVADLAATKLDPGASETVAAAQCVYAVDYYEIDAGTFLELAADAVMEIG